MSTTYEVSKYMISVIPDLVVNTSCVFVKTMGIKVKVTLTDLAELGATAWYTLVLPFI